MRIFTGFDAREQIGWHVCVASLMRHSVGYELMPPLCGDQRDGTNRFTYQRFLVPELCGWDGWALFIDGTDMMLRADIAEIWKHKDSRYALQVVKHDYVPRHSRKYIGTEMETANAAYPRKNWSSVVLWNCGHMDHYNYRHELATADGAFLHRFAWLDDAQIGDLPIECNWLDEYGENEKATLIHYTNGIPGFSHYAKAPHAKEWLGYAREVTLGMSWT